MGQEKWEYVRQRFSNFLKIYTRGDHNTLNLYLYSFMHHDLQVENIYEKYCRDG